MRTTVDIEDDVLPAVKELARRQGLSMGTVLADLARPYELVRKRGPGEGRPLRQFRRELLEG